MTRVLMGDFSALLRRGFEDILNDAQLEVISSEAGDVLSRGMGSLPHVVVLYMDKKDTDDIVNQIVQNYPAIAVISCSSATPTMRVFPPFHRGESYTRE